MRKGLKIGIGAAAGILLAAALYVFYRFDPQTQPVFPRCPFLLATGCECPGCGSQRAIHNLLHFNIGAALRYNAFVVVALPYVFLGLYMQYFGGKRHFPQIEKIFFGKWAAILLLVFILTFWVVRNL